MPGAIIRGELQAIRIGRYCFIGEDTVIRPAYRQVSAFTRQRVSSLGLGVLFPESATNRMFVWT